MTHSASPTAFLHDPKTVAHTGRFAPSPTGPLHFGSLVAAVASYADARAVGGRWLVRIEDVDVARCRDAYADEILRALTALGFVWDGDVFKQSQRGGAYRQALESLKLSGDAFFCTCSRREIADSTTTGIDGPVYPGTCRPRPHVPRPIVADVLGRVGAWRLNVHAATEVMFVDRVQGEQRQHVAREVGDFVLLRRDGFFAYQLAVVVDDAEQGVTDVVRGADLLDSTARQIYLHERLGLPTPRYLHVPVACDASGQKLSKQTQAPAISTRGALGELQRAWVFLGQQPIDLAPAATIRDFWQRAWSTWRVERIPKVRAQPAP